MLVIWRSYVYYTTMLHTQAEEERLQHRSISWSVGTCPGSARVQNTGRPFNTPSTFNRLITIWPISFQFHFLLQVLQYCCYKICKFYKPMYVTPILTLENKYVVLPFFVQLAIANKYCRLKVKTSTAEFVRCLSSL